MPMGTKSFPPYSRDYKKIIVAPDSFKGSLTSEEAGKSICDGLEKRYPDSEILRFDVADGGEGTARSLAKALGGNEISVELHGPDMLPISSSYYITDDGTTALIDLASASGITLIETSRRNPMTMTTFGTGEMILHAFRQGVKKIIIGLGGSATNDAGIGMLQALGYDFIDLEGNIMDKPLLPVDFLNIAAISSCRALVKPGDMDIMTICDVDVPLWGSGSASRVFAPQKGADEEMVEYLDSALRHIWKIYGAKSDMKYWGAAGGTSSALEAVLGARLLPGASAVLDIIGFDESLSGASLIITEEGSADSQTLLGKLPGEILRRGISREIPVIIMAGKVSDSDLLLRAGFEKVVDINAPYTDSGDCENPLEPSVARKRLSLQASLI